VWKVQGREPLIGGVRRFVLSRERIHIIRTVSLAFLAVLCCSVPISVKAEDNSLQRDLGLRAKALLKRKQPAPRTPEEARVMLAKHEGRELELEGLDAIDAKTAQIVAGFRGEVLMLDGLTALTPDSAKALASYKGALLLNGVATLDVETATSLAAFNGYVLALCGVKKLDALSAKALAGISSTNDCCMLALGVTEFDEAAAKSLANVRVSNLILDGLTKIDPPVALALARFKGAAIHLNGLSSLDPATATSLAKFNGILALNGLTKVDALTASALAKAPGVTPHQHIEIEFDAANPLSPETALSYAYWSCGRLDCIEAIDSPDAVAIAKALATKKGPLSLPNLKKISPKTLSALIEKEDIDIPLIESLELIPEPDGSPTEDVVIPEAIQKK
jgi:hypothetical protein